LHNVAAGEKPLIGRRVAVYGGGDVVQKAHGVDHSGGINGWDVDAFG